MGKFFTFNQNNSGGKFVEDKDVAPYVVIEAESAEEANTKAEEIGIYFEGVDAGSDCPCCGDRWYMADYRDGKPEPMVYGEPVSKVRRAWGEKHEAIVHYKNGTIERFPTA
jgi:hypothetical protein